METTEMEQSMQWFVFFKDQLLLKKEYTTNGENKYGIPHGVTPPVTPAAGCKIHEVTLTGGKKVKACALGQPVPETEEWVMTGLRASYDYLPLADYQRQRNIAGTCTQLPRHVPRAGSRLPRNGRNVGTMRRAGSYGRNGAKGEKHHLFRQPALALSQRINGRIHSRL